MRKAPQWGVFIHHADLDVLAVGALAWAKLFALAFYHGTQALEKYFKALYLSIVDPDGQNTRSRLDPWLRTHDLLKLSNACKDKYPYYGTAESQAHLKRFSEFDQVARYPWVEQRSGNGFTAADFPVLGDFCCRLRNDLPIAIDDYMLGIAVRGYHHNADRTPAVAHEFWHREAMLALRQAFPQIDKFVRWP